MTTTLKYAAAIFAVAFVLFLPSVRYEFVDYDDNDYIISNDHMRNGLSVENIRWAIGSVGYADNWHPLAWASLMLDVSIYRAGHSCDSAEDWAFGTVAMKNLSRIVHGHNVVLHAINAALLFLLMIYCCRGSAQGPTPDKVTYLAACFFALFWAVHPLRVEPVCWAAERKELLCVAFMLLSLICYRYSAITSILTFLLALSAKPVAVAMPAIVLASDLICEGKVRIKRMIPFVALSLLVCVLTIASQGDAIGNGERMELLVRVSGALSAPLIYLWQTIWPVNLSCVYEVENSVNVWLSFGGGLLVLGMIVFGLVWIVRYWKCRLNPRRLGFGSIANIFVFLIAWSYVGLIPMLGIVKVGCQSHSDRYTYWIGCGLSIVGMLVFEWARPRVRTFIQKTEGKNSEYELRSLRKGALGIGLCVVALLFFTSSSIMPIWANTITLFRNAVEKSWSSEIAAVLAKHLYDLGPDGDREAEAWLRECAANHPSVTAYLNLAECLMRNPAKEISVLSGVRQYAEAEQLIDSAIATDPQCERARVLKKLVSQAQDRGGVE